jgi:hypothetical protein
MSTSAIRDINMFGVTGTLAAGAHTIHYRHPQDLGNGVDDRYNDNLGEIFLGGYDGAAAEVVAVSCFGWSLDCYSC